MDALNQLKQPLYPTAAAWWMAMISMLGSLYFSDILKYPPCTLCWYQRIFMYPLVLILGIAIYRKDWSVWIYGLPLAIIGWLIAAYHNLLYYGILAESEATCQAGVSCTTKFIEYFGFVTIPFLSLMSFTAIIVLLLLTRRFATLQK